MGFGESHFGLENGERCGGRGFADLSPCVSGRRNLRRRGKQGWMVLRLAWSRAWRSLSDMPTFWGLGKLRARPIAYGSMITAVLLMVNRLGYENDIVCFDPSIGISSPGSKLNTSSIVFPTH